MRSRLHIALALPPLLAALVVCSIATYSQNPAAAPPQGAPLNDAQVRALVKRAVALQHQSDEALDEYDRTERIIDRDDDKTTDTTSRLVPVGGGDMRVETNRDGKPVPPAEIGQKWREVLDMIQSRTHLEDPAVKKEYEKAAKRRSDTAKMVDAIYDAFNFHWAGRAMREGRPVIELNYEPNPDFKSTLRFSGVYKQIWGKVFVDEASGYVVRLEAELRRDIPIGGGIVGKVYKGAHVELEQAEAVPGVWLPSLSSYNIEGRKFLFPASLHRKLYASEYRRIGPPAQALALLRNEHAQVFPDSAPAKDGVR